MTDLTHEHLVADVAYIIASNKSEKAGYVAGLILATIREALKEPTEAMSEAFFRARDEEFPAQMAAARSEGRGWLSMPAVVHRAMLLASPLYEGGK